MKVEPGEMVETAETAAAHDESRIPNWVPEDLIGNTGLGELLFSDDYRLIALKGVLASLMVMAVAGFFALMFRA